MEEVIVNKYGINPALTDYTEYANFCIKHQCFKKLTFETWKKGGVEFDDHYMFGKSFWEEAKRIHRDKYGGIPFDIMYLIIAAEIPPPIIIKK